MNDDQKRTADLQEKCNAAYKQMALDDRMRHIERQNNSKALRRAVESASMAHYSCMTPGTAYQAFMASIKK